MGNAVTQERPATFGGGVTANGDGRLEVFRGTGGGIQHKWQKTPNGQWSAWSSLAGPIHGAPVAVTDYDGRVEVFGTASNGALYHAWQKTPGGTWSAWGSLGGSVTSGQFSVFMNWDGRLEMFTVTSNGEVAAPVADRRPVASWSGWAQRRPPGGRSARLSTTMRIAGGCRPGGGHLDHRARVDRGPDRVPGGDWSGGGCSTRPTSTNPEPADGRHAHHRPADLDGRIEMSLVRHERSTLVCAQRGLLPGRVTTSKHACVNGGMSSGNLAVGRNVDGRLEVMDQRSGGTVVHAWQTSPGGSWYAASLLPSSIGSIPAPIQQLADLDGRLELFSPQGGKHVWQTHVNGPWLDLGQPVTPDRGRHFPLKSLFPSDKL